MGYLTELSNSEAHPAHTIYLTTVDEPFECDGCNDIGFGCAYQCKEKGCGRIFHEECARPQEITSHPLSKGCHFIFSHPPNASASPQQNTVYRFCDACGIHASGFFYACYKHGKYGHFIHPSCMKLKHRIILEGDVELELKGNVKNKCDHCGHKHASEGIKGWSYCSSAGDLCLHIKCVKDIVLENWRTVYLNQRNMIEVYLNPRNMIAGISSSKLKTITSKSTMTPANAYPGETSASQRRFVVDNKSGKRIIAAYKGKSNFKEHAQNVMKLLKLAIQAIVGVLFGSTTVAPLAGAVSNALSGG